MLRATTPAVEGRRVVFGDGFAGGRDRVGGRGAAWGQELRTTGTIARRAMEAEAEPAGGITVVGADLDSATNRMGPGGGTLTVSAGGTAVVGE